MADWTTLPNTAVGVGGLPSGTTVTALRDNPVAIAEGAPGAPRIAINVFSTSSGSPTFTDLDQYLGFFSFHRNTGFSSSNLFLQYSTDNGSTFASSQILFELPNDGTIRTVFFDFASGMIYFPGTNGVSYDGASSEINAIKFSGIASGGVLFYPQGGRAS